MVLETYFDFAENDFQYFTQSLQAGIVANMMGAIAQGICEKYMKHLISEYDNPDNAEEKIQHTKILSTHSLDRLIKYVDKNLGLQFSKETKNEMKIIDGYHFSTQCPGETSIELDKSDIEQCGWAISHCREAVIQMIKEKEEPEVQQEEIENNVPIRDDELEL